MAARTTIEVDAETRDRLRRFKSIDGRTYDEAIDELLDAYPWVDPAGGDRELEDDVVVGAGRGGDRAGRDSDDDIGDLEIQGSGAVLERRRDAIRRVRDHILEVGGASRAELLELVDVDELNYAGPASAWENCLAPALRALEGIEATGSGGTWVPTP